MKVVLPVFVLGLLAVTPGIAEAQSCRADPDQPKCSAGGGDTGGGGGKNGGKPSGGGGVDMAIEGYTDPANLGGTGNPTYSWMHGDVGVAFSFGYNGAGSRMIIVDDHLGADTFSGNLTGTQVALTHGGWTSLQAGLVAPGAVAFNLDFSENFDNGTRIEDVFEAGKLNVVNLSYGLYAQAGSPIVNLGTLNNSIVTAAGNGEAVFVKAAGNTWGAAVDDAISFDGGPLEQDYLNLTLIGTSGALFVGALEANGDTGAPAAIADYSTVAGTSKRVQKQFLVVGVEADDTVGGPEDFANYGIDCGSSSGTCLYGTSFAAPIVTGYAAMLGQKFNSATPALIVDQLLNTARTDTILGYNASIHGRGEADLSRALAPLSVN